MRMKRLILPVILLLGLTGPALAEEIVYFTNGTSMPIRSHEIKGDMLHVDLGSEAFMAFPLMMVEKIEAAGQDIALAPSFSGGNNIMTARVPDPGGNYPVRGSYPGHHGRNEGQSPRIISADEVNQMDGKLGLQVRRPMQDDGAANRRAVGVTGRANAVGPSGSGKDNGGVLGTRKVGTRNVIGGDSGRRTPDGKPLPAVPLAVSHGAGSGSKKGGSSN
jgi:hypothetical protein